MANARFLFLEGPPNCEKHRILEKVKAKLLKNYPLPPVEKQTDTCPIIFTPASPFRQLFTSPPVEWWNFGSADFLEREDEEQQQIHECYNRRAQAYIADTYMFELAPERRPVFILSTGVGPLTCRVWNEMFHTYYSQEQLQRDGQFWSDCNYQAVCFCPDRKLLKAIKKNSEQRADTTQNAELQFYLDKRGKGQDLDLLVEMSKLFEATIPKMNYQPIWKVKTVSQAVNKCYKLMRPSWVRAVQEYERAVSQPPLKIDIKPKEDNANSDSIQ